MIRWLAVIFLIVTACSTTYYVPNARNVPMFSSKKEFQATGSYQISLLDFSQGGHLQTAYSFTDHFGAMANVGFSRKKFSNEILAGHIGEIGVGYFKSSEKLYYDFFAGYGIGKGKGGEEAFSIPELSNARISTRTTADFYRVFLQPSIAFRTKRITLSFALRASMVHFNNTTIDLLTQEIIYSERQPVYYFEPTFSMVGSISKRFKLLYQTGYNITRDIETIDNTFSFSLGVRYLLSPKILIVK